MGFKRLVPGLQTYVILYLAFLYIPVLFLPLFSFNDGTIVAFPIKGFTLKWYGELAEADTLVQALFNSLLVGAVTAVTSTAMGLFAARAFGVGLAAWVLVGSFAGYFWQREGERANG